MKHFMITECVFPYIISVPTGIVKGEYRLNRLDKTSSFGILFGLAALIGGFLWEGGHWEGLFEKTALLIVFGGTFAATAVSYPWKRLKQIPEALILVFRPQEDEPHQLVEDIVEYAHIARREGVLALEKIAIEHPNRFLRDGLQLVVDGTDPDLNRQILEVEIDSIEQRLEQQAKIFDSAGGYAPTMGIIGTVMGLIHVLGNLSDPSTLGPSIAVAFTATLYGVASANLIYLPLSSKIRSRCTEKLHVLELMLEGILALQAGEHPNLIRKKLTSFLMLGDSRNPATVRKGASGCAGLSGNAAETRINHDRWLITYADLITLLLIFFVVLYAMSQVDVRKYDKLAQSLQQQFRAGDTILEDGAGILDGGIDKAKHDTPSPSASPTASPSPTPDAAEKPKEQEKELQDLLKLIQQYVSDNNLEKEVSSATRRKAFRSGYPIGSCSISAART